METETEAIGGGESMITCECGHGIDIHDDDIGCKEFEAKCPCMSNQETVEARAWARRMMKERDEIQTYSDLVSDANETWHREYDALQAKLDVAVYEAKIANDGFATIEKQDTDLRAKLDDAVEFIRTIRHNVFIEDTDDYHNFRTLIDAALKRLDR